MSTTSLEWWAENLPADEGRRILVKAANEHTARFSNPEDIGQEWAKKLYQHGYNSLCPYARNYLAHQYLKVRDALAA